MAVARPGVDAHAQSFGDAGQQGDGAESLGPPQQRLDPAQRLARAERLDHVVVGAELQPEEPVVLLAPCAQDDDGGVVVLGAAAAQHLEAGHEGQHDVEDDDVGTALTPRLQGGQAVGGEHRLESGPPQIGRQDARDGGIVLDDQHGCDHLRSVCR